MPLSDIVDVVITRQTQTISEAGFGVPMILGTSKHFLDLIKFYSSIDEVALDFSVYDKEYIAAQDIFSQEISPSQIAIGRRQVDDVTISVITAMASEEYRLIINGFLVQVASPPTNSYSVVTLNSDLVVDNTIAVDVNGSEVSLVTQIDFDIDFEAGNSISTTINGVLLTPPVVFTGNSPTTLDLIRDQIAGATGVDSATVTGGGQITVVFDLPTASTVTSVITTGGTNQPVATIENLGFVFNGTSVSTMNQIADAIGAMPNIMSATLSGVNSRTLTVIGDVNTDAVVNSFLITQGVTQPVATISNLFLPPEKQDVVLALVQEINNQVLSNPDFPVTAVDVDPLDDHFELVNRFPGQPWTLDISTSITATNYAIASVTQIIPGIDYTVSVNNIDFTYRSQANIQNGDEIATALVELINLADLPVVASNLGSGSFDLTSNSNADAFSVRVTEGVMAVQKGMVVSPLVASNPVADDLTAINNENNSWYALISTDRTQSTVLQIAAWVESRIKLFGTASSDQTIIDIQAGTDTTSIAAQLGQLGYVRSFVMYHQDAAFDFPEAAWFGRVLPLEPGSETWKFKTLNGISYSSLTTTQSNNALNKKANTYEFVGGVGITSNGTVSQGEYIDIVRGVDWLTARIQEFVFRVLVANPKVPYTDAGIASIQAEVMRVLQLGISNDFIASDPAPTVTVPRAADVSPADKAARILRNVKFQATLSGAIHAVVIRGNVSV